MQHEIPNATEMSLAVSGRYVDEQVLKGRALNDVLAEGKSSIWMDPKALYPYSRAVRAQVPDEPQMDKAQAAFMLSARWVDEQVLKGRALDDVLAEVKKNDGVWFHREHLRPYSRAIQLQSAA